MVLKGAANRNLLQTVSPSRPAISPAPYRDQLRIHIKHIDIHHRYHASQLPDDGRGRQLRAASRAEKVNADVDGRDRCSDEQGNGKPACRISEVGNRAAMDWSRSGETFELRPHRE